MPKTDTLIRYRVELIRAGRPGLTAPAATEKRAREILTRDAELAPAQVDYLLANARFRGGVQVGNPDDGFWLHVEA